MGSKNDGFFDRVRKKLFPDKEKKKDAQGKDMNLPVHKEMIERSQQFLEEMDEWKKEGGHKKHLMDLLQAFQWKTKGKDPKIDIHLHHSPYGNGFFFPTVPGMEEREFFYLFDHFRDRTLKLGYRKYMSDRRVLEREDHYETVERHFLKPPINKEMGTTITNQLYGNVLIEHHLLNNRPSHIKVMATFHSDSKFSKALPFDELVEFLLGEEGS